MMKFKYLIMILIMTIVFPTCVLAKGDVSVSNSKINVLKGGKSSFVVTADNSAGRIDITSSNSEIVKVSESSVFLDMDSSTITVTGVSVGTATITVYLNDVTTYDDVDLSGKSYTINITVSEPEKPKSNNNKLKSIEVLGYELDKVSDNEFRLSVMNDVESINIITSLEDEKASVRGNGVQTLNVGENVFEIIVTSESGKENKYILNIIRKDGYYFDDLTSIIDKFSNIEVKIDSNSVISSDILKKVKDGRKKLILTYNDDNNKINYSWSIDGNKIKDTNKFVTTVSYIPDYKKDIDKLTNYADGLYLNLNSNNKLSSGLKLKVFVDDKFENGKKLNLYCYNREKNNLNFVSNEIVVDSKYIELEVTDCSNYFVTMSNIGMINNRTNSFNIFIIISIVLTVICFFLLFLVFRKNRKIDKVDNIVTVDVSNQDDYLNGFNKPIEVLTVNNNLEDINYNNEIVNNNNAIEENNVITSIIDNNTDIYNVNDFEDNNGVDEKSNVITSITDNDLDNHNVKVSLDNSNDMNERDNVINSIVDSNVNNYNFNNNSNVIEGGLPSKTKETTMVNFAGYNIDLGSSI